MKTVLRVISVFLLAAMVFSCSGTAVSFAEEYELSSDPALKEARDSFEKAQEYMEKGDLEFRRRPGQAQKLYEHAEDYFLKAVFLYRELGEKQGINVDHDVAICDRLQRKAHVMVNKSRKKRKRAGSAY